MNLKTEAQKMTEELVGKKMWDFFTSQMGITLEVGEASSWEPRGNRLRGQYSLFGQCNWSIWRAGEVLIDSSGDATEEWISKAKTTMSNHTIKNIQLNPITNELSLFDDQGFEFRFSFLEKDENWTLFFQKDDAKRASYSFYQDRIECEV